MGILDPVIKTAGPNTAILKTFGANRVRIQIGGTVKYFPFLERIDLLNLELRTLNVETRRGISSSGARINVLCCCQVKIQGWNPAWENSGPLDRHGSRTDSALYTDEGAILLAAQHFLGKSSQQIDYAIKQTIAGHQRAILSTLTVEELIHNRDLFCEKVIYHCNHDLRNMGLSIVSYTVVAVTDDEGYIDALGELENARIQREKVESEAQHRSRANLNEMKRRVAAHINQNKERIRAIFSHKQKAITDAKAQASVDRVRAAREKAFAITSAEREAELLMKKKYAKAAEVAAELAVLRRKIEKQRLTMERTVQVEADARYYKRIIKSDRTVAKARARAEKEIELARANAEAQAQQVKRKGFAEAVVEAAKIRREGLAEAQAIRSKGLADAEIDIMKARTIRAEGMAEMDVLEDQLRIWKEHGNESYMIDVMINDFERDMRAIVEPLVRIEGITIVDQQDQATNVTSMISILAAQLPAIFEALVTSNLS
ncbi:Flotillin [Gracilaria domingensis]|nr:Flotillin [Gracilaria domingensis]